MTEHGRVPVCATALSAERHCYHAHFLLFPAAPAVEHLARTYFADVELASTLEDALKRAAGEHEYFLLSPAPDRFLVMKLPARMVRQFARLLVAGQLGAPELADWRRFPKQEEARNFAATMRALMGRGAQ
jgi:hypothetical protein